MSDYFPKIKKLLYNFKNPQYYLKLSALFLRFRILSQIIPPQLHAYFFQKIVKINVHKGDK